MFETTYLGGGSLFLTITQPIKKRSEKGKFINKIFTFEIFSFLPQS